jgi:hypothetical protein
MKKYITILFVLFTVSVSSMYAQYAKKHVVEGGGSISFSSTTAVVNRTTADQSTTVFQFMPYINYFLADGFSLGLSPAINSYKAAGQSEATTSFAGFLVPGYTFTTKGSIFPFIEALVGYNTLKSGSSSLSGLSYGAKGGVKMAVGTGGLVSAGVSYMLITLKPEGADGRNGYNGLAISLGFSIYVK